MTLIERNYQKLARAVIINAYREKAKSWIKNEWNFELFCGLANVIPEEIKKQFVSMKEEPIKLDVSKPEIAKKLGVSYATVHYWHTKLNSLSEAIKYIKNCDHKSLNHSKLDKYYDDIIYLRKEKKSWIDISKALNVSYNTLYAFSKKMNID
jgi:transposase